MFYPCASSLDPRHFLVVSCCSVDNSVRFGVNQGLVTGIAILEWPEKCALHLIFLSLVIIAVIVAGGIKIR